MTTEVTTNGFVSPHYIEEIGEEGLTNYDVAKSLGVKVNDINRKGVALENSNEIRWRGCPSLDIIEKNAIGLETRQECYALTTDDAKFLVTQYQNKIGRSYCKFLIQVESTARDIMKDPFIQLRVNQINIEKEIASVKQIAIQAADVVTQVAFRAEAANTHADEDRLTSRQVAAIDNKIRAKFHNQWDSIRKCYSVIKREFIEADYVTGMTWKDSPSRHFEGIMELVEVFSPGKGYRLSYSKHRQEKKYV